MFPQELFKATQELQEKKADKQMVESEIVSGFIWTYERVNTVRRVCTDMCKIKCKCMLATEAAILFSLAFMSEICSVCFF